jgi:hypothetical protein
MSLISLRGYRGMCVCIHYAKAYAEAVKQDIRIVCWVYCKSIKANHSNTLREILYDMFKRRTQLLK